MARSLALAVYRWQADPHRRREARAEERKWRGSIVWPVADSDYAGRHPNSRLHVSLSMDMSGAHSRCVVVPSYAARNTLMLVSSGLVAVLYGVDRGAAQRAVHSGRWSVGKRGCGRAGAG
jgi:hypothetical protein